jgi:uncharacterized membrane protein YgcG
MDKLFGLYRAGVLVLFLAGLPVVFQGGAAAADVKLAWSPNSEGDLAGYGIYYRRDAGGPPFELVGYVAVEELPDRDNPTFTVSGLLIGSKYYFAATAYDDAGNESAFSNTVCASVGDRIELCDDAGNGSGGGGGGGGSSGGGGGGSAGGGGGGGGCFIRILLP